MKKKIGIKRKIVFGVISQINKNNHSSKHSLFEWIWSLGQVITHRDSFSSPFQYNENMVIPLGEWYTTGN